MRKMLFDTLAVSSVIGYIFSFALSAIILIISLNSFTSMQDTTYERAVEIELLDAANRIVAGINTAVDTHRSFPNATYSRYVSIPGAIKGRQYSIVATNDTVYVNTTDGRVHKSSTTYKASAEGILISGIVYSGPDFILVQLNGRENNIEIRSE